jgi:hypothetical protein
MAVATSAAARQEVGLRALLAAGAQEAASAGKASADPR